MSELAVIVKTKDLAEYIFQISERAPKKFRMTLLLRMQNLSLDIVEKLMRANNEKFIESSSSYERRKNYQSYAKSDLDILCAISEVAKKQQCIQPKHYYQICMKCAEIEKLLVAWMKSDASRIKQ